MKNNNWFWTQEIGGIPVREQILDLFYTPLIFILVIFLFGLLMSFIFYIFNLELMFDNLIINIIILISSVYIVKIIRNKIKIKLKLDF